MTSPEQSHTGLSPQDIQDIQSAAAQQPRIRQILLFGSRAKGTHHAGSDVDLAVQGTSIDTASICQLAEQLNQVLPLPYVFDILDYDRIAEPALKDHIDRVGISIYRS